VVSSEDATAPPYILWIDRTIDHDSPAFRSLLPVRSRRPRSAFRSREANAAARCGCCGAGYLTTYASAVCPSASQGAFERGGLLGA